MKFAAAIIVVFLFMGMVTSQRSPYAPNPIRYPDVNPRFRVPETQTEQVDLANRNREPQEPTTTVRLPIDARGNVDVVNTINRWPEDRKPFWFVNAEAIEASRSRPFPAPGQNVQIPDVPARSPFLGSQP